MVGLRNEVGGDWWNYLVLFADFSRGSFANALTYREPAYALLNWMAGQMGWGIWFPNLVCAAIFTWGLIAFCRRQPNPALGIVVAMYLVILVGMGYTRQSAALGFILLAIVQYHRGAAVRVIVSLGLAVLFHTSAIVVAPILALAMVKRGPGTVLMMTAFVAVVAYQFSGAIADLVDLYVEETFTADGAIPRLLMNVIPAVIFLTIPRLLSRSESELRLWTIVSFVAIFSLPLLFLLPSSLIVDRLGLYLTPIQIFVLARLPSALGTSSRQNLFLLSAVVAFSLAVQVVWLSYGTWGHAWLPYRNYLWDAASEEAPRWYREFERYR